MEAKDDPDGTRPRGFRTHSFRAARRHGAVSCVRAVRALAHRPAHAVPPPCRRPHRPDRPAAPGASLMQTLEEPIAAPAVPAARPRPWTVFASSAFRKLWVATILSL